MPSSRGASGGNAASSAPPPAAARTILAQQGAIVGVPGASLAHKETLAGALAIGSAAVAWWRLINLSSSLSALKSARETTIAELSRAKKPADAVRAGSRSRSGSCNSSAGLGWLLHAGSSGSGSGLKRLLHASSSSSSGRRSAENSPGSIVEAPHELVAVRGVVQASGSGYHGWRRLGFGGGGFHVPILQRFGLGWRLDPLLLPEHGLKQACAIVERTETILNTNLLYGWLTRPDRYSILFQKSIPFSLAETTHQSAPRVEVSLEGATQPLPLHTVYSHVHKAHPSWGNAALHVLTGKDLLLGLRTDERVLPINHDLTAVGHVRFGSNGRPAIFASPKLPYFLISDTKEGMLQRLNCEWRMLLGWCLFLSAAAVGLVGFALWRANRRQQSRQQQQRQEQAEQAELERRMTMFLEGQQQTAAAGAEARSGRGAEGARAVAGAGEGTEQQRVRTQAGMNQASHVRALAAPTLELERSLAHISGEGDADEEVVGEEVQSGERCVVCLHRKRKAVFVPCGHRVCCVSCSRMVRVEQLPCPICRGQILAAFRVYDA